MDRPSKRIQTIFFFFFFFYECDAAGTKGATENERAVWSERCAVGLSSRNGVGGYLCECLHSSPWVCRLAALGNARGHRQHSWFPSAFFHIFQTHREGGGGGEGWGGGEQPLLDGLASRCPLCPIVSFLFESAGFSLHARSEPGQRHDATDTDHRKGQKHTAVLGEKSRFRQITDFAFH